MSRFRSFKVKDLFDVRSGDFHAIKELDTGSVPLISCGDYNNGLVGYFAIPNKKRYSNTLTVAYNGSWPLTTKFHPYEFGAKDDVAVLLPHAPMKKSVMLYVAALLNRMVWRYSYGRKCFREKLQDVEISLPVTRVDGNPGVIDETVTERLLESASARLASGTHDSLAALIPT